MPLFSMPHPHMRKILPWAQMSPSRSFVGEGKILETCGAFMDCNGVEYSGRPQRCLDCCGRIWKRVEHRRVFQSIPKVSCMYFYTVDYSRICLESKQPPRFQIVPVRPIKGGGPHQPNHPMITQLEHCKSFLPSMEFSSFPSSVLLSSLSIQVSGSAQQSGLGKWVG